MLNKILYLVLSGISPWIAGSSLPTTLAQSPQVQYIEQAADTEEVVTSPSNQAKIRSSIQKFSRSDADVMDQFDSFAEALKEGIAKGMIKKESAEVVLSAASFAAEKHEPHVRSNPSKTPYIVHPLEVATLTMKVGSVYDEDILITALLHDVMDGSNTTYEEVADLYGQTVSQYVKEMSDGQNLGTKEQRKQQIIHALHQTPGVAVVKFADKLSNLNTLSKSPPATWSRDRIDQYFQWAQAVVENLPDSNHSLKESVKHVIVQYWEMQEAQKKSS